MAQRHEDQASPFATWYDRIILGYPAAVVLLYLVGLLFFAYQLQFFRMDASSDSLVLENDADLKYYDNTREIFGSDDYIIVALSHDRSVLSDNVLASVEGIAKELGSLEAVSSVQSILSVPLFHSPKVSLFEMGSKYQTLLMEDTDRRLAFEELTQSPLFSNNLISSDGKTTAIIVTFEPDLEYNQLRDERFRLRQRRAEGTWTEQERLRLDEVSSLYNRRHTELSGQRRDDVRRIRGILANYRDQGYQLAESGLPVVVADMVSYIERDILVFGIAVIVFLAIVLGFLFRQTRWVLLPLSTCSITVVLMMGYLGLTGWETTVVTSNFSSLLLIVSMAYAIHLTVRYREIHARSPERGHREILLEAVRRISVPTFYTSATTVVGFLTLIVSGIRPVMDFGYLMAFGVGVAYVVNFTFFPAAILLFPKGPAPPERFARLELSPVRPLASFTRANRLPIQVAAVVLFLTAAYGMTKLKVESRFIDFFRSDTSIAEGLVLIDNQLGGTTSLEVVLDGKKKDHWLKSENLELLRKIHQYSEQLPDVGKVLSLHTLIEILTGVNNGIPPNRFILNVARTAISDEMRAAVLKPYVNEDFSQARVFIRIRESSPTLQRNAIVEQLRLFLHRELGLDRDQARVTGILVLFNNLLESLFDSQIKTLGMVFIAIYLMLVALFRSFYLALLGIVPTSLPVLLVLGTMGLAGISLDMMTIMIASVTFGIAVDNVIHYTHRYRLEFQRSQDYEQALFRSHNSIGLAILYSSLTIVAGFGILALSNFIPTIYFGVFTSMAMAAALLGSLTLLPMLILWLKPLGSQLEN